MLLLLDPYVDVILALALAYLSLKIVQALFGPLNGLPVVGGAIAKLDHAISQSLSNACGQIVHPVDIAVGGSLAGIASLVNKCSGFIRRHARLLEDASGLIAALAFAYHGIRSLAHELHGRFAGIESGVKTLEREFHGIEHRVKTLERDLTKGIGHDLRTSVHDLTREVGHIEHSALPAIRAADAQADTAISNLYAWARGKADLIGIGTFAGAVALALTALGLDWLKCKENPFRNNAKACGLWSVLGRVLGLAAFLTIAFDFQEFVDASEQVAQFVGKAVGELEGSFPVALPPLPPPKV